DQLHRDSLWICALAPVYCISRSGSTKGKATIANRDGLNTRQPPDPIDDFLRKLIALNERCVLRRRQGQVQHENVLRLKTRIELIQIQETPYREARTCQ